MNVTVPPSVKCLLGVWSCQRDSDSGSVQWLQMQCNAPEDLQFAVSSVSMFIITIRFPRIQSIVVFLSTSKDLSH